MKKAKSKVLQEYKTLDEIKEELQEAYQKNNVLYQRDVVDAVEHLDMSDTCLLYTSTNEEVPHSVAVVIERKEETDTRMDLQAKMCIRDRNIEYQAISVPVTAKGHYSGCLVLFQDISKTLEGEKMQKRFIADASHELKTPIAVLKGMIEILNREDFHDEETQKEFLKQMEVEIERLDILVKDLLQLCLLYTSGYEKWIAVTKNYALKEIFLKKGCRTSLQYHEYKEEHCYVLSGKISIEEDNDKKELETHIYVPGDIVHALPYCLLYTSRYV